MGLIDMWFGLVWFGLVLVDGKLVWGGLAGYVINVMGWGGFGSGSEPLAA